MLLAAAAPAMAGAGAGLNRLDSWAADGHTMLDVAGDGGIAITRHPSAHRAAAGLPDAYGGVGFGVGVYAALRAIGRDGVAAMVERITRLTLRFADGLRGSGRAEIVNEVVSNRVLVRWPGTDLDHLMAGVHSSFLSTTTHHGERLMRISLSGWALDDHDIDQALEDLPRPPA